MRGTETEAPMSLHTIAVIGARAAGREIAWAAACGGFRTVLEDASEAALESAVDWIRQAGDPHALPGTAELGALRAPAVARTVEDAIREADLVIETLPDEEEMKIELFTILDRFARPHAIFASNTVLLAIDDLAAVTVSAERCIGMRFFRAGERAVLKLVRGRQTSEQTVAVCREAGRRMGREVWVVGDGDPHPLEPPQGQPSGSI
jgi:3-hydroxybutyryl-CoA dehydrogenase